MALMRPTFQIQVRLELFSNLTLAKVLPQGGHALLVNAPIVSFAFWMPTGWSAILIQREALGRFAQPVEECKKDHRKGRAR